MRPRPGGRNPGAAATCARGARLRYNFFVRPADLTPAFAAVLLLVGAARVEAEPARRLEAGGFLGLDYFGDDIELGNAWADEQVPGTSLLLGVRGSFIALPDLAPGSELDPQLGLELEGKFAFASTSEAMEGGRDSFFAPVIGWRVQGIGRVQLGSVLVPHLVVGFGGESVLTDSPFMVDDTDAAFHWGPGVSWRLTDRLQARVDLRHGVTAGRQDDPVSTFEAQFGLMTGMDLRSEPRRAPPRDRDGDGIVDRDDACDDEPETVNGFEDDDGCPDVADRDGDGIVDDDDACPDDAETDNGVDDADGCPEVDGDGDGLVGSADRCPDEPEDVDGFEDGDGCRDSDNDGDTVMDAVDLCPDVVETRNGFDDEDGCPDEVPPEVKAYTGVIEGITFEYGKARIQPRAKPTLGKAAATLNEHTSIRIRIEGHTDDRGKREANLSLSQKRADAVKWYLVDQGIAADRIETVGHGPDLPRVPGKTAKARAANRRIEFHIIVQDPTLYTPTPLPNPDPNRNPDPIPDPNQNPNPDPSPTPPPTPAPSGAATDLR